MHFNKIKRKSIFLVHSLLALKQANALRETTVLGNIFNMNTSIRNVNNPYEAIAYIFQLLVI